MEAKASLQPDQHPPVGPLAIATEVVRQKPWTVAAVAAGVVLCSYQLYAWRRPGVPEVKVTTAAAGSRPAGSSGAAGLPVPPSGGPDLRTASAADALAAGGLDGITPEEVDWPPPAPVSNLSVLDLAGKLALAALAIYAFAAAGKRLRRGPLAGGSTAANTSLRVIESVTLGPGRSLHIVEAAGRSLLVSSDGSHVALLTDLSLPAVTAVRSESKAPRRLETADMAGGGLQAPAGVGSRHYPHKATPPLAQQNTEGGLGGLGADGPASLARKREMLVKALQQRAG